MLRASALAMVCLASGPAIAGQSPTYGAQLEGFDYPHTLKHFDFESQRQSLQMGYMDVPASGNANGRTVVLMHGKNFCAATWETSIDALSKAGYRVIAPDQIGFCTSSKPAHYQYSFQQLASNTHALLEHLGVKQSIVLGHSTGGMLATRYALMYPQQVTRLAMVNPIGLEDWKALGCPTAPLTSGMPANSSSMRPGCVTMSAKPTMPAAGNLNMSAGCRCWWA